MDSFSNPSNRELSDEQLDFLKDDVFLPAKITITQKLTDLLNYTGQEIRKAWQQANWPLPCHIQQMKVSRGENYLALPYLVLDYPATFSKENIFACRTMCWWGQFFSFTLHLQGNYLNERRTAIQQHQQLFIDSKQDWYIGVNDSPWQYHFKADNYRSVKSFTKTTMERAYLEASFR